MNNGQKMIAPQVECFFKNVLVAHSIVLSRTRNWYQMYML